MGDSSEGSSAVQVEPAVETLVAELSLAPEADPEARADAERRPLSNYATRPEERPMALPVTPPRAEAAQSEAQRSSATPPRRLRVPEAAVAGCQVSQCRYAGRVCSAPKCGERIGQWAVSVGAEMTHNTTRCILAAVAAFL